MLYLRCCDNLFHLSLLHSSLTLPLSLPLAPSLPLPFSLPPSKGEVQLAITLNEEKEEHILAAAAWALGQIGRHSAEHSKAIAKANVLPQLLKLYLRSDPSSDLCSKVRKTEQCAVLYVSWQHLYIVEEYVII